MPISILRLSVPVVIAFASILSSAPSELWAGQDGSRPSSGVQAKNSRHWDSSDFVHVVVVKHRSGAEDELAVTLRIDDGFHINANPASLPYLIPTSLAFAGVTPLRIAYPAASRFKPNFTDEPLDVYQGTVVITAFLPKGALDRTPALGASVTVQACTDAICLPPAALPVGG
jgi:uncharacterized protein